MGSYPSEAQEKLDATRGAHARFSYKSNLVATVKVEGDEELVLFHRQCALRSYFIYLVDTTILIDKSETYIDVLYVDILHGFRVDL